MCVKRKGIGLQSQHAAASGHSSERSGTGASSKFIARERRKFLTAAEDFAGDGEQSAGAAVPFGDAVEAEAHRG
jgi:hypothetical protein